MSSSREYWKSRGIAMLWATVYSTQSEIGPLGEAAIGNEGGWPYPRSPDCGRPCTKFKMGVNTYTNNTGWVDFTITPTVGTLWIVAEDALDRFIADPYQRSDTAYRLGYPKNPARRAHARTLVANVLRGQKPWYRDWQNRGTPYFTGARVAKTDEEIEEEASPPRFEFSPHSAALSIAVNTPTCQNGRATTTGEGVEVSYRLMSWLDATLT